MAYKRKGHLIGVRTSIIDIDEQPRHLSKLDLCIVGQDDTPGEGGLLQRIEVEVVGHRGFSVVDAVTEIFNGRYCNQTCPPWLLSDKDVVGRPTIQYKKNALVGMRFFVSAGVLEGGIANG